MGDALLEAKGDGEELGAGRGGKGLVVNLPGSTPALRRPRHPPGARRKSHP